MFVRGSIWLTPTAKLLSLGGGGSVKRRGDEFTIILLFQNGNVDSHNTEQSNLAPVSENQNC